jgi:hypothetical protein
MLESLRALVGVRHGATSGTHIVTRPSRRKPGLARSGPWVVARRERLPTSDGVASPEAEETDMIVGAHSIIYSKDAEADRRFLRDVLGFPSVDAGGGWLIFGLPASEVAVHPSDGDERHEFYLMCDDIQGFVRMLARSKVPCSPVHEEQWGSLTLVTLPGGGRLGVYQPKHRRPVDRALPRKTRKKAPVAAARRRGKRPGPRRSI